MFNLKRRLFEISQNLISEDPIAYFVFDERYEKCL
jgi:hypothetical protein